MLKKHFFHGQVIFVNLPGKMPKFQNLCKIIPIDKNSFQFQWISLLDIKLY